MKILFITHHYLSSNGGGSFASRAYINAFAENADEMTLLYPVKDGEDLFPEINKKIKTIPVKYNLPKWRKLVDLLCGRIHRYFSIAREMLKEERFDVVVFDTSLVSYRIIKNFKEKGSRTIVIHHNYQYEYFKDNAKGVLSFPTLLWCKRYEKQAVRSADLNLTLTKQDIELLANNYNGGNKDSFSLLGVFEYKPREKMAAAEKENRNPKNRFVITGSLCDFQTKHSLISWLQDYYPVLKQVFSDASLTIAGRNPGVEIQNLCRENDIHLIPSPKSMDPIMENADYYICPTFLGGGLKLRVMDGLKWGLPVISHSVSARGYELFEEHGCLISYRDLDGFKRALDTLKKNYLEKEMIVNIYQEFFTLESGIKRVKLFLNLFR
ncbi:hypothetical protein B7990_03170 [Fibrobacter sp. UWB4]|uniref:glycosyltransferase n=1 Tax=Fibrobacter sp. UWB4 TaxID=1964356 RepID=UPI000B51E6CC|nr:glycosyltransferase [Fibrobacter sp. UWB4]OWV20189.1 hypothetical protein B7990_03170 [Fibrobacter sp. UWB4]